MGEEQNRPFQVSFNVFLKVDSQGSRVTSDGGLIVVDELDERLGFGDLTGHHYPPQTHFPTSDAYWRQAQVSTPNPPPPSSG